MKSKKIIAAFAVASVLLGACSSLKLTPAEFGWPIESVLKIDDKGFVSEDRFSLSFNTKPLFMEEKQDSMAYVGKSIRLIRNNEGFYFITAPTFKNVYVFKTVKNALSLEDKFLVDEMGLKNPVFNQRPPFIELIDGDKSYNLTSEGFSGGKK